MHERTAKLNSANVLPYYSIVYARAKCAKCPLEIGLPIYNPPILRKKSKIANPPNITPHLNEIFSNILL